MLILTRKLGETIRIGNEITVTIVEVKGGQIRVGIDAPSDVVVHREEIYQMIREQNIVAAGYSDASDTDKGLSHLWDRLQNPVKEATE